MAEDNVYVELAEKLGVPNSERFPKILDATFTPEEAVICRELFEPATCQELADRLDIKSQVEFTGFVSQQEKVERLRKAWVAVCPSLKEGWGLTNIEANACGTSVIAANSPGLRDSVVDNETGYLYEYGNIDQLAEKLEMILLDDTIRTGLETGGRNWAARFNWDDAADKFLNILQTVADGD